MRTEKIKAHGGWSFAVTKPVLDSNVMLAGQVLIAMAAIRRRKDGYVADGE